MILILASVNKVGKYLQKAVRFQSDRDFFPGWLTASAVVLQPATGLAMMRLAGYPLSLPWLRWTIALYVLIGCCWLPVVWLQVQMRNLAARAIRDGTTLSTAYLRYYRWWFYLGWPAFTGVLFVFYLMVVKPSI
jgi:uncharacterized membrane protein